MGVVDNLVTALEQFDKGNAQFVDRNILAPLLETTLVLSYMHTANRRVLATSEAAFQVVDACLADAVRKVAQDVPQRPQTPYKLKQLKSPRKSPFELKYEED